MGRLREGATKAMDVVPGARRLLSELARVEVFDRSLALGAQALLALIPFLMVLGAFLPTAWSADVLVQVRHLIGVDRDVMGPLRKAALGPEVTADTSVVGLVIALVSATSFSRALQRMYARAWDLPTYTGLKALRGSLVWLVGWVLVLQLLALLLKSLTGAPLSGFVSVTLQLLANSLLWWWTAWLLLGGRLPWRRLLPGAVLTATLLVVLSRVSGLFMPRFARRNLEQFGPLGGVFSVASWLVLFGGTLIVATVVGRLLAEQVPQQRSDRSPSGP